MRKIYATGGWLHYPPLEFYYMQGEINVEPVQFVLPKTRKEVDLTALSYQIKAVSEDYGTEAAWILPKRLSEEHISRCWGQRLSRRLIRKSFNRFKEQLNIQ